MSQVLTNAPSFKPGWILHRKTSVERNTIHLNKSASSWSLEGCLTGKF